MISGRGASPEIRSIRCRPGPKGLVEGEERGCGTSTSLERTMCVNGQKRSSEAEVKLGAARASASVVTHPEHEIFHPLNERMFLFNLIGSVVEPHVVHRTLALSCNDFHDVLSKGLAGGISRIA